MHKTNKCSGKDQQDLLITHEIALIEGIAEMLSGYSIDFNYCRSGFWTEAVIM
ncbi:hypothetical protein [Lucifera butyrica]|uniref:hypothetical protein n=1 Tax=Lucifera butyrica TaxID=1351585 RepID=UPI0014021186|nr:hypothetical protein [Lucifera butyrica]